MGLFQIYIGCDGRLIVALGKVAMATTGLRQAETDNGTITTSPQLPALRPVESVPRKLANGKFVTTATLTNRTGKWPIGDPAQPGFHYCGQSPRLGQPYCEVHDNMSYQSASRKKAPVKPIV